ncbi:MAG: GAF domain-containing protein [Pseudomonadota bacterium]
MTSRARSDEVARPNSELADLREREAAIADILHAISRSQGDEIPVYDMILKHASNLCGAPLAMFGLISEDRTHFTVPAYVGAKPDYIDFISANPPELDPDKYAAAKAMVEMKTVAIEDLADPKLYGASAAARTRSVAMEGIRSAICVPMILHSESIGGLFLYRREVSPFSKHEIALVETFASQAVIAIENVRQFLEVQSRLQREAATRKVLEVISQSRDDAQPVFDRVVQLSAALCRADRVGLHVSNEDRSQASFAAQWGPLYSDFVPGEFTYPLTGDHPIPKTILSGATTHIHNLCDDPLYRAGNPVQVKIVEEEGFRTLLVVPLVAGKHAIGAIALWRTEVRAFSDDEVALAQTFSAQAAIAIENVRQFKALETLNAELGERVEKQVGEIERIGKLKRFLPAAVADTVVSQGSEKLLSSHRALLGVLFCDIRGFTAFCETAEPEETIEVLQNYHEEMGKLISEHGAGVDHRMGDGIMVLFNDPIACDDPAGDAVRLAIAMRARMEELAKKWKRLGHRLGFGVGISLGYATVGMVGYEGRYDYTASGTAVNLAARLCDRAEDGEILLSPRARIAVEDDFDTESAGEFTLKGMREAVEVFCLANSGT